MKKMVIPVLVCLNVALLLALIHASTPQVGAQLRGATDYVAVTGRITVDTDVLYVIDIGKKRMASFVFKLDKGKGKMFPFGSRRLKADFPEAKEAD